MTDLKTLTILALVALGLLSCASPRALPRRPLAPAIVAAPAPPQPPRLLVEAAERAAPDVVAATPRTPPTGSAARPSPVYRTFVEYVDVPDERAVAAWSERDTYESYLQRAPRARRPRPSPFPINAAVGAGVGAVIGHQRGRRDEGALWGAGIGLLFDFARWSR